MSSQRDEKGRWALSDHGFGRDSQPKDTKQSSLFRPGAFSRRRFLGSAAGAAGAVLSSGLAVPGIARAARPIPGIDPDADDYPQHLPGGIQPFASEVSGNCPSVPIVHIFPPGAGSENSTIWDFNGFVGVAQGVVDGTGTLGTTPPETNQYAGVNLNVDMRFMSGTYEGLDGNLHQGSFAMI